MVSGGEDDQLMAEINVTPFVDVMLVLLIIFMVTAPMMVQGVDVSLPEAASGDLSTEKEHLIVTVDRENRIHINEFAVTLDTLREKMEKIRLGRSDQDVFLRADKAVPYGMVVQVMAEVKAAGVEKLGMVTEPVDEQ